MPEFRSEIISALLGAIISGAIWFVRDYAKVRRDINAAHVAIRGMRKGKR
jgi:cytoskeletal protein CcmA (bactofilin family)